MANPSYTYTLTNGTTADADQVMQNFNDILAGITDSTKDMSISALTVAGTATFNGNVSLGNSSGDDVSITGSIATHVPVKTTNAFDFGSSTLGFRSLYLGANSQTVRILASSSMSATWSLALPVNAGTNLYSLITNGSGVTTWTEMMNLTGTQTAAGAKTFSNPTTTFGASGSGEGRVVVQGAGSGYADAAVVLRGVGATRGGGIYSYNDTNDTIWYSGNTYNTPDEYRILRKGSATSFSEDAADATVGTTLFLLSNAGTLSIKGALIGTTFTTLTNNVSVVSSSHVVWVAGTGNIDGFTNGVSGQVLHAYGNSGTSSVTFRHNNAGGTQKLLLPGGVSYVPTVGFGGATFVCDGSNWILIGHTN